MMLVGGFNHLEQYEFVSWEGLFPIYDHIWKIKNVWNHNSQDGYKTPELNGLTTIQELGNLNPSFAHLQPCLLTFQISWVSWKQMFPSFFCGSISGAMLFKSIQWIGWENLQETIDFPNQEAQPRPVRLRLRMEKGGCLFSPWKHWQNVEKPWKINFETTEDWVFLDFFETFWTSSGQHIATSAGGTLVWLRYEPQNCPPSGVETKHGLKILELNGHSSGRIYYHIL